MALPDYSARDVQVSFAGAPITGLAPDSFITFSLSSDLTSFETGADGSVSISISPDETGSCTISLQQQSLSNNILSGVLNFQRARRKISRGALTIVDPSGSLVAQLRNCHIMAAPEFTRGSNAEGSTVDWQFFCEELFFASLPEGAAISSSAAAQIASGIDTIISNL